MSYNYFNDHAQTGLEGNQDYIHSDSFWIARLKKYGYDQEKTFPFLSKDERKAFELWANDLFRMSVIPGDFNAALKDWVNQCIKVEWPEEKWPSWINDITA